MDELMDEKAKRYVVKRLSRLNAAQRYGKPCEMFELKEEKKNDK